jgi:hypothetical protein
LAADATRLDKFENWPSDQFPWLVGLALGELAEPSVLI